MVASNFDLNVYNCQFYNNTALPYLQLVPLTYRFVECDNFLSVSCFVVLLNKSVFALLSKKIIFSILSFVLFCCIFSGAGGAVFAQTAQVNFTNCQFMRNYALTGQFDSGSAGGAMVLEDCYPATLTDCVFEYNGAAGYYGM